MQKRKVMMTGVLLGILSLRRVLGLVNWNYVSTLTLCGAQKENRSSYEKRFSMLLSVLSAVSLHS